MLVRGLDTEWSYSVPFCVVQAAEMVFTDEPGRGGGGGGLRAVLPEEGQFGVLAGPLVILHALNSTGCVTNPALATIPLTFRPAVQFFGKLLPQFFTCLHIVLFMLSID